MKVILFILPNMKMGGAERIIMTLINSIDKTKYKSKLLLMRKEGYYLKLLNQNTEIIELKKDRIRNAFFPVIKAIRKYKPAIVFGGWGEISAFLSPIIPFFPKIHFITRETNIVSKHVTRPEIKFFYKFYNNFSIIVAQSEDMKSDLIKNLKIKESKIVKINNPVDFDLIEAKLKEKIELPYLKENKNVIAIGNLSKRKGFDNLLKVFMYLKEENIHLYIIGEGDEEENLKLQKEQNKLNNVHFLGKKTNPFPFIKNADLFVLSSRYEGFPNVLLEAGACGVFSIVNNCKGGINEIIQPNINGKIVNIENFHLFANEIKREVNIQHEKNIIKKSIKDRYSKEKIIRQYEDLFSII